MPFLDSVKIEQFINSLNVQIPSKEKFQQLTNIFPIYPELESNPIMNYERGMLLYALIAKFRPKNVLPAELYYTIYHVYFSTLVI